LTKNIFATLCLYSVSEENSLTEAFVYLLNEWLIRDIDQAKNFLQKLIGKEDNLFADNFNISITTQESLSEGRPDISIQTSPESLFYIEVKHDSPLHKGQLEGYLNALKKSGKPRTKLILLTRTKQTAIQTTLGEDDFRHVCWYEIYDWLESVRVKNEVIKFLIFNFLQFLEGKAMNLARVEWEYPNGVKSMINLTNMLEAAIVENYKKKLKRTAGWSWRGFYIDTIFCGFRFDKPNLIVFENNLGTSPTFKQDLNIDREHFLAFSKEEQFECIDNFFRETFNKYRNLNIIEPPQGMIVTMEEKEE
jgi:hypothetical protein